MRKMFVFLGDIVASKKITREKSFQKRLESACRLVNERFREEIHSDFKIIKGIDEIGGVLKSPYSLYMMIDTLLKEIHPYRMRMVLVFDYIDVGLETGDVSRMDGPSFHRASMMIEELKKTRLMFRMSVKDELLDSLIEGQINLILLLKSQWSEKKHRIIEEYEKSLNQRKVAKILKVTQQAVSKSITSSHWKEIKLIEERLNEAIKSYPGSFR